MGTEYGSTEDTAMASMDILQEGDLVAFVDPQGALMRASRGESNGANWQLTAGDGRAAILYGTVPVDAILVTLKSKDGKFFGFRSATAEGKVLQACSGHGLTLRFVNHNFGPWEQWQLSGEVASSCTLTNRKFGDKQLTVSIKRVEAFRKFLEDNVKEKTIAEMVLANGEGATYASTNGHMPEKDEKEGGKDGKEVTPLSGSDQVHSSVSPQVLEAMVATRVANILAQKEKEVEARIAAVIEETEAKTRAEQADEIAELTAIAEGAARLAEGAAKLAEKGIAEVEARYAAEGAREVEQKVAAGRHETQVASLQREKPRTPYADEQVKVVSSEVESAAQQSVEARVRAVREEVTAAAERRIAEAKMEAKLSAGKLAQEQIAAAVAEVDLRAGKRVAFLKRENERLAKAKAELEARLAEVESALSGEEVDTKGLEVKTELEAEFAQRKMEELRREVDAAWEAKCRERVGQVERESARTLESLRKELTGKYSKLVAHTVARVKTEMGSAAERKVAAAKAEMEEEAARRVAELEAKLEEKAEERVTAVRTEAEKRVEEAVRRFEMVLAGRKARAGGDKDADELQGVEKWFAIWKSKLNL